MIGRLQSVWKIHFGVLVIDERVAWQKGIGEANLFVSRIVKASRNCAFALYLRFPTFVGDSLEVEMQNIQTRRESLKILEDILCANLEKPVPLEDHDDLFQLTPLSRKYWQMMMLSQQLQKLMLPNNGSGNFTSDDEYEGPQLSLLIITPVDSRMTVNSLSLQTSLYAQMYHLPIWS